MSPKVTQGNGLRSDLAAIVFVVHEYGSFGRGSCANPSAPGSVLGVLEEPRREPRSSPRGPDPPRATVDDSCPWEASLSIPLGRSTGYRA